MSFRYAGRARIMSFPPKRQRTSAIGMLCCAGLLLSIVFLAGTLSAQTPQELEQGFLHPPESARPWVYWFWLNGNITREGITADLEAMQRVGIGGVLIMEVDQGAPVGPVDFMDSKWRELFKHVVSESQRLGLEVNMNNDAGWNGSGGPWIKPDESMQKVVWSETNAEGPRRFEGALSPPPTTAGFYRDIAVLAFPETGPYRIENINVKAGFQVGTAGPAAEKLPAPDAVIDRARMVDLTSRMDKQGQLAWDVPAGKWTIVRFGHTSTGAVNAPAPLTGRGLECDKLSREGIEANFAGMMAKLIADVGPAAGKTLVTTHIDSWENGPQNWTARMRDEFQKRRGYDLLPYLPAMMGRVVDSLDMSERFLWDLRQTISDLIIENYAGHMRELASRHGLKLSIEAYVAPCDELTYAGRADEPMAEFWMGGGMQETCKEMASAAHTYGKPILGAEAFTAGGDEKWLHHPGSIKSLGDRAFCAGVNRFVFHRYAMQPWAGGQVRLPHSGPEGASGTNEPVPLRPGMTMGPWGLHYERTNTWWEDSGAWHQYLARCQFLLRQGLFVADLCYLQPEAAPQGYYGHPQTAYDFDNCNAEVVLTRMSVKDGRLVLPDGMSYRLLVLPDCKTMTPALLGKITDLVRAGATIVGPRPLKSPSLVGYPACDEQVKRIAGELWGDGDGTAVKEHRLGKGRVFWGPDPQQILTKEGVPPDFASQPHLNYIHRTLGETDIYFVANPEPLNVQAVCSFRVTGKRPELWWPETGRIEMAAVYQPKNGITNVSLQFPPSGSVFVLFRNSDKGFDPIVEVSRDGRPILSTTLSIPKIIIEKAVYGVLNDPQRTREVRAKVQQLLDRGETNIHVARLAEGDDPASGIVKTLVVDYTFDGQHRQTRGTDPETVRLASPEPGERLIELRRDQAGEVVVEAWQPGQYKMQTFSGRTMVAVVPALPAPLKIAGSWEVRFAPGGGAPPQITLDHLISWSEHPDPAIRYFSGAAIYRNTFELPSEFIAKGSSTTQDRRLYLDLGKVEVITALKMNGRELGVLWKPPYSADVTDFLRPGENTIEARVVNLWPNRMIGDEQLPEDSERNENGTLKAWPKWLQASTPGPTGRLSFTSWRLWKKNDNLLPSGLLGPVQITAVARSQVKPSLAARARVVDDPTLNR